MFSSRRSFIILPLKFMSIIYLALILAYDIKQEVRICLFPIGYIIDLASIIEKKFPVLLCNVIFVVNQVPECLQVCFWSYHFVPLIFFLTLSQYCIIIMSNNVEHLLMYTIDHLYIFFVEMSIQSLCSVFNQVIFHHLVIFCLIYIFWIQGSCQIHDFKYLLLLCGLSISLS